MNKEFSPEKNVSREHRKAKTKLALVAAAAQRMEEVPLEAISIRDLCQAVGVSETTFFNYFGKKSELLAYCVQLWNLEIQIRSSRAVRGRSGLVLLGEIFEQVATHVQGRPGLTGEIIAFLAKHRKSTALPEISAAEKRIAFPEFPNLNDYDPLPVDELLRRELKTAVQQGELPKTTNIEAFATALASLFFGAPIAMRNKPAAISQTFRRQLNLLWLGVRSSTPAKPRPKLNSPSLHHRDY